MLSLIRGRRGCLLTDPSIFVLIECEWLSLNCIVDLLDKFRLEVLLRIDTLDHLGEVFHRHATLRRVRVVQRSLHHHGRIGQQKDTLSGHLSLDGLATFWVIGDELLSEALHDSIDDLAFARQAETKQHSPERLYERLVFEVELEDELFETGLVQLSIDSKELTNTSFIQCRCRFEEIHNALNVSLEIIIRVWDQLGCRQVLDSILPFKIELCSRLTELSLHDTLILKRLKLIVRHQICRRPVQRRRHRLHIPLRVLI